MIGLTSSACSTSEVHQAYHALPLAKTQDYGILKEEILAPLQELPPSSTTGAIDWVKSPEHRWMASYGSLGGGSNLTS